MTDRLRTHLEEEKEQMGKGSDDVRTAILLHPNHLALEQQQARWKRARRDLSISASLFIVCLLVGVVFFKFVDECGEDFCEDTHVNTFTDALYMSVITMTTVGFGDIVPASKTGRIFSTLWMMLGVAVTVRLLGNVSSVIDQGLRADVQTEMTRQLFHDSDENGDGYLDEMEFMQLQFVQNGLASKSQFDAVRSHFKLIAGDDGKISLDEYAAFFLPYERASSNRRASAASRETPARP